MASALLIIFKSVLSDSGWSLEQRVGYLFGFSSTEIRAVFMCGGICEVDSHRHSLNIQHGGWDCSELRSTC